MTVQLSVAVQNARDDAIEATIGTSAKLQFFTGAKPANCAAAATGTLLVTMSLPSDYMANATGGSKALSGVWSGTAVGAGTAGYFRILDSAGAVCHIQGTITAPGGGGDLIVDNPVLAVSQTVTQSVFSIADGNP